MIKVKRGEIIIFRKFKVLTVGSKSEDKVRSNNGQEQRSSGAESPAWRYLLKSLELNELKAETAYSEEATTYVEIKLYRNVVKGILFDNGEELTISDVVVAEDFTEPLLSDSVNIEIISFNKGLWGIMEENRIRKKCF